MPSLLDPLHDEVHHSSEEAGHALLKAILKAIEIRADRQVRVMLSPNMVMQIAIQGTELAGAVNEQISADFSARTLGLMLLGEPATASTGTSKRSPGSQASRAGGHAQRVAGWDRNSSSRPWGHSACLRCGSSSDGTAAYCSLVSRRQLASSSPVLIATSPFRAHPDTDLLV